VCDLVSTWGKTGSQKSWRLVICGNVLNERVVCAYVCASSASTQALLPLQVASCCTLLAPCAGAGFASCLLAIADKLQPTTARYTAYSAVYTTTIAAACGPATTTASAVTFVWLHVECDLELLLLRRLCQHQSQHLICVDALRIVAACTPRGTPPGYHLQHAAAQVAKYAGISG
jgi:hypothetical protein